jgi:CPA1 family monovalent cation:H+ antiporter
VNSSNEKECALLSIFDLVAILLTVSAVFAFINAKLLRLPTTIGVMIMGLAASLILIGVELLTAGTELSRALSDAVRQIDFTEALMHGMLAFMLFAGALQVDLAQLRSSWRCPLDGDCGRQLLAGRRLAR